MKRNAVMGFVVFFLMLPVPGVEAESIEMSMQALHRFGGSTSFVCNPSEAVDEIHCSISATGAADGDFNAGLSDNHPPAGQSVTVSAELANYVYSSHAGTQDLKVAQVTVWGTTTDSAETVELASFDVVMDVPYFAEAVNGLTGERLGAFAAHDVTPPGVSTEVAAPPTMAGYDFAGWRGRAVDLGCVSMASDLTVRFNMYRYFITLGETTQCRLTATYVPEPDSTLTISSTEGGAVTYPGEGAFAYSSGETTPVVAAAETGYEFAGWSGTAVSTGKVDDAHAATALVEIDGDDTLVANFSAITGVTHTLNTSSGSGGSVTLPGEGEFIYSAGSSVLVEAEAENGYRFSGWSGTAVSAGKLADTGVPLTTVRMDGDYTLRASFSPVVVVGRWLTISSGIGGSVTSPGEGGFIYTPGSCVSVVATPETGYKFARWTGTAVSAGKVADPSAASTTVIVDDGHTLYAEFSTMVGSTYALTISSEAGGAVSSPGEGTFAYARGSTVSVAATAAENYAFSGWSGTAVAAGKVADVDAAATTVTMGGNYTLVATFTTLLDTYILRVSSSEGGSVVVPGGGAFVYEAGTEVRAVALPDAGYTFLGWTGTLVDTGAVADPGAGGVDFVVEADETLHAEFAPAACCLYVDDDAAEDPLTESPLESDPAEDGTWEHPFDSVQEAIDAAATGDAILVLPGTYREHISFQGKDVTVSALDRCGGDAVSRTILAGVDANSVVVFAKGESAAAVLAGFTILGGRGQCGGGICCHDADPIIANCLIVGNRADLGAGVYCQESRATLANCTFADNYDWQEGGGFYCCLSDVTVINSIFSGNQPEQIVVDPSAILRVTYSAVRGGWPGEGNLDCRPCFVDPGCWSSPNYPEVWMSPDSPKAVWTSGDYHLQAKAGRWNGSTWVSDSSASPCVDRGSPYTDVGCESLPNGARINLGAFGGTAEASRSPAGDDQ